MARHYKSIPYSLSWDDRIMSLVMGVIVVVALLLAVFLFLVLAANVGWYSLWTFPFLAVCYQVGKWTYL